jgi:SAM-dependent methyltransferase
MEGMDKRTRMLGDCAIAEAVGLEVGALNAPLVRKSEGRVRYVDYACTEVIRANQHDPAVKSADLVEVDIVWGEVPLAAVVGAPVDYVLASHVIEHVPDLIGWLDEMHAVLRPGGTLGLALPDRRFTFDLRRRESTLSEMVEAHLLKYRCPSIRQVFDACLLAMTVDAEAAWRANLGAEDGVPADVLTRLPDVYALAESLVGKPRYVDAHCWVFTPGSFLDAAEGLERLGFFPYEVAAFFPTDVSSLEFQVRLTATARERRCAIRDSIVAARRSLQGAESESVYRTNHVTVPLRDAAARIAELERQNTALHEAIGCITASTSWRITAPLRAVSGRVRGRDADGARARGRSA